MFGISKKKASTASFAAGSGNTNLVVRPDPFALRALPPRAKLVAQIGLERVDRVIADDALKPAIGDVVVLDQGFTAPNGEQMVIVYCKNSDGSTRWGADVFENEIELIESGS